MKSFRDDISSEKNKGLKLDPKKHQHLEGQAKQNGRHLRRIHYKGRRNSREGATVVAKKDVIICTNDTEIASDMKTKCPLTPTYDGHW